MAPSQQENDLLQKEANEIMKELLNTPQKDQEHQAPHYQPTKTTTLVRQLFIGNVNLMNTDSFEMKTDILNTTYGIF